jgi:putative tryptophan/tyrosine transport system substrate-binding protein
MRRRAFITLLGGAAVPSLLRPRAARAQQPALPVVGFVSNLSQEAMAEMVDAFRAGLARAGYVAGRDITIEFRWADGRYDRLPVLVADLIQRRVQVIVAAAVNAALAAKAATTTIPIVFNIAGDPVEEGLVASLNQPGGNLTGVTSYSGALSAKRFELLRALVPGASEVGILVNPRNSNAAFRMKDLQDAARTVGQRIHFFEAGSESELDSAFVALVQRRTAGLLIVDDPLFGTQAAPLVALATRHAVPTIHYRKEFVRAGGLMSYAADYADRYREIGNYVARIIRGENPGNLPVQLPTKFELVVNLKTAKALGIDLTPTLLALADEVIE